MDLFILTCLYVGALACGCIIGYVVGCGLVYGGTNLWAFVRKLWYLES
jgi:anaerobic C4-dicarboxylate transporter